MAVSTPAGFTTIVTLLLFIRDNFCALTNSCRHVHRRVRIGIEYGLRSNFYTIRFVLYIELK